MSCIRILRIFKFSHLCKKLNRKCCKLILRVAYTSWQIRHFEKQSSEHFVNFFVAKEFQIFLSSSLLNGHLF